MKIRIALTLLLVLLAWQALPRPNAASATHDANGCLEIYVFASGETLHICPPDATATTVPADTETPAPTDTATAAPAPSETLVAPTSTDTARPTDTPQTSTQTPAPTETPAAMGTPAAPFASAPRCPNLGADHDTALFHTLWDAAQGCHYDHEHGTNPFTPAVAAAFPGLSLQALLGGVQIGHTNPSSPMENTHKHGGFKWDVHVPVAHPCAVGFENATVGVGAAVIQYHNFGDYSIEFESRIHTAAALLSQCLPGDPSDRGYVYTTQFMEYGQRTSQYQGDVLIYPDNFEPAFASGFGPYLTVDCVGVKLAGQRGACRESLAAITGGGLSANSKWTSKPTGSGARPPVSSLLQILFDVRDTYQVLDWVDQTYPFTFKWLCSGDGGNTYNPAGCRYNNTTSTVHEIAGFIPAAWDGLAGWDNDPRMGRITADGFVTRFGQLNLACTAPGTDCHPVKLVGAFVGKYGASLCATKCSNNTVDNTPERDLYFLNGQVVSETTPGAVPSGWVGPNN